MTAENKKICRRFILWSIFFNESPPENHRPWSVPSEEGEGESGYCCGTYPFVPCSSGCTAYSTRHVPDSDILRMNYLVPFHLPRIFQIEYGSRSHHWTRSRGMHRSWSRGFPVTNLTGTQRQEKRQKGQAFCLKTPGMTGTEPVCLRSGRIRSKRTWNIISFSKGVVNHFGE